MDENSAPCLSGTFPVWIDIGANHQLIVSTIEIIQRQFYQDKHGGSLYLLYDDDLHEDVMKKLQSCWEDSRTCMNWRSFIGCETETIIFITYGVGKGLYFGETQCQNKSVEIIYYICTLGCSDYQKKIQFQCWQKYLGQKICPEKKLENGFFPKIDVAIVGWH